MMRSNHSTSLWHAVVLLLFAFAYSGCSTEGEKRVLVFSKTNGWKHTSIPYGVEAIFKLGSEHGFVVDTTCDSKYFDDFNLKLYSAVIFNNTTRNVLNAEQQAAFERFIQAGGGFVGIHAAADTEYEWPWYDQLVGAHFSSHPHNPNVREATVMVTDTTHASTKGLPSKWPRTDEWYNFRSFYSDLKILAYLDENTYEGGTNGADHPIAWYHEFDGGRAFYTGGGHENSSFQEPLFLNHLLGGIQYAMGESKLDYRKAHAVAMPEENRFVKEVLVNDLNTPMELAIAEDGRLFFTELRTANLSMYDTRTGKYSLVHQFKVETKGGTGLIGIALDPKFKSNNFLYVYYSKPTEKDPIIFNLSRFTLKPDNTLDTLSEKVLLQVPAQINSAGHHGGSIEWDKDGNLYLSTGDSSSPFPSDGYAPIDERPGEEFFSLDAQRSASNTNDLKGKILRIHPEADGSYTIPPGNLFPKGQEKTRPEIFVMGCRNPYRIAVNPKSSVLYWGEIGPDAGKDSIQGPRGYDEFNQAKKAGNYGWPYFVGNNEAYAEWDFATKTAGPKYNPAGPVNNSPNNTGLQILPPALPAMIYYPYAASDVFPELGKGGRSAMAGQFYQHNGKGTDGFPEYYDGALFVFDWMRNWVLALRFDEQENFLRSEPFMSSNGDFRRPIDLAFSQEGVMYMLEYGSVYGADNEDARLVRITYNAGNRAPGARATVVDSAAQALIDSRVFLTSERRQLIRKASVQGKSPLRVRFSSAGSSDADDDDRVVYEWDFGNGDRSSLPNPIYTYQKEGVYRAILKVTDIDGLAGRDTVTVSVGNSPLELSIVSAMNQSFFWDKENFSYQVKITGNEDKSIMPGKIQVSYEYNPEPVATMIGATLIAGSDCKACHTVDKKSIGPSYVQIAQRYRSKTGALQQLTSKIIAGGGGSWGTEHVMSAHPQHTSQEVSEMVKYIFSLTQPGTIRKSLGVAGTLPLRDHKTDQTRGIYTITASYPEKVTGASPISAQRAVVTLRSAKVKAIDTDAQVGFARFGNNLANGDHKSYLLLKDVDMNGITAIRYEYASENKAGEIQLRLDSQAGPVTMGTSYNPTGAWDKVTSVTGTLEKSVIGRHNLYIMVFKGTKPNEDIINLKSIEFLRD